jgi:hypothetical protein
MGVNDMTNEELQIVVSQAVTSAVKQTLTSLGIDASDPIKTQEQMSALRDIAKMLDDDEFKKDLAHVRKWRQSVDKVSDVTLRTAVGVLITGFFGLLLFAITTWVKKQ